MGTCRSGSERLGLVRSPARMLALAAVVAACGGPGRPTEVASPTPSAPPPPPPVSTSACDAPVVSPAYDEQVSGRVELACEFPPDRCEETFQLEFYVKRQEGTTSFPGSDATLLGFDTTHPYSATWDTRTGANGPYLAGCCAFTVRRRVCSLSVVHVAN